MFTLDQVVPWGRSFDEYRRMFALSDAEVRIFPLLALGGAPSSLVKPLAEELRDEGASVSIEDVPYEFQRGGNKMLRIRNALETR